jgi:hypothetical protein
MAKLNDGTRIYGSLIVEAAIIAGAGAGFQTIVGFTTGTSITYSLPTLLRVPGAKFKLTIIGGGGGGAGSTAATAGSTGGGGGSGGVVVAYITVVAGIYTFVYSVGAAGTGGAINTVGVVGGASSVIYNGVTYTAGGGGNGVLSVTNNIASGGTATGGTLNLVGTDGGASGVTSNTYYGYGGDTPLYYGRGGHGGGPLSASGAGVVGLGYGAGGGGAHSSSTTGYTGAAGTIGVIILEY